MVMQLLIVAQHGGLPPNWREHNVQVPVAIYIRIGRSAPDDGLEEITATFVRRYAG